MHRAAGLMPSPVDNAPPVGLGVGITTPVGRRGSGGMSAPPPPFGLCRTLSGIGSDSVSIHLADVTHNVTPGGSIALQRPPSSTLNILFARGRVSVCHEDDAPAFSTHCFFPLAASKCLRDDRDNLVVSTKTQLQLCVRAAFEEFGMDAHTSFTAPACDADGETLVTPMDFEEFYAWFQSSYPHVEAIHEVCMFYRTQTHRCPITLLLCAFIPGMSPP